MFVIFSNKTIYSLVRDNEQNIKDFFLRDIDEKLKVYEPGEPKNKPDVLEQIKEIENKREVMIKEEMEKQKKNAPIMVQQPGKEPKQLASQEVVSIMQNQLQDLQKLNNEKQHLEIMVKNLQEQLMKKTKELKESKDTIKNLEKKLQEDSKKETFTRIPIEIVDDSPTVFSKSSPEVSVQIQGD